MSENREINCSSVTKWLRVMMYAAIVSFVNGIVNVFPFIPGSVTAWTSRCIVIAMVVCLYQLSSVNEGYRKAWVLRTAMLGCMLITAFLWASSFLNMVASILSILAVYQEYNAHSELVTDKDTKLSAKWHSLFNWSIIAAVLVGFGSTVAVLILSMLEMDVVHLTAVIVALLGIPQLILDVVYITYLKKMIDIFTEKNALFGLQ